ncbi:cation:H+ antiporter [Gemmobacter megaterium]|uniref:Cation:H+ antiporter n=1 Tax=Gemmobacter megaterium TaxID=1086013 RepID=A0A1N7PE78_9RHOB|nr:calcium/sodium antiporter [Gemmobacter megaterium]GGE18821.1 sodium:calcium antiporter [Gemmobacter megaterium]SIT08830.1 cation:H+ antiporter [Gemmobacter megaterium]
MDYLFVAIGLVGLFLGGDALVRGAVGVAQRLAMPPLLIGLTVVGFGTSMPELLVSVQAALGGVPALAIGNIVGSNLGNILLITGISALIWPIRVSGGTLGRDTAFMVAATLALVPLFWMGWIGRPAGAALVIGLIIYLVISYRTSQDTDTVEEDAGGTLWKSLVWLAFGFAVLLVGARLLVDGSVNIARSFGVSEAFIGLTIVAIGTSLPELATSLAAAIKKHSEIAIGNIVGSNIFNLLGILGATAVVAPIPVETRFLTFDLPVLIAATLVLTGLLLWRPLIGRWIGAALLASYAVYIVMAQ